MAKQVCGPPGYPSDGPAGEAFYAAALPCVERAWQPLFERARMEYGTPTVMVPVGTIATSPCGTTSTAEAAAFYCSSNETIYMPIAGLPETWTEGRPLNYLSVFAHEFGHHVQGLTGTLVEAHRRERRAGGDTPAGLELNRRSELQVQCFAGMFIESIVDSGGPFTRPDIDSTRRFEYGGGNDSPTHGTAANVEGWWVRGTRNQIADCNTWSSSSAEVA
jgi:predicted metalloprotease